MTTQAPSTVSELYPRLWLKPEDLRGAPVDVVIKAVAVENFRQRDGTMRASAVLTFEKASRRMILNKTQSLAIAAILESERFSDWPGKRICLVPATAPNGKPTVEIVAARKA